MLGGHAAPKQRNKKNAIAAAPGDAKQHQEGNVDGSGSGSGSGAGVIFRARNRFFGGGAAPEPATGAGGRGVAEGGAGGGGGGGSGEAMGGLAAGRAKQGHDHEEEKGEGKSSSVSKSRASSAPLAHVGDRRSSSNLIDGVNNSRGTPFRHLGQQQQHQQAAGATLMSSPVQSTPGLLGANSSNHTGPLVTVEPSANIRESGMVAPPHKQHPQQQQAFSSDRPSGNEDQVVPPDQDMIRAATYSNLPPANKRPPKAGFGSALSFFFPSEPDSPRVVKKTTEETEQRAVKAGSHEEEEAQRKKKEEDGEEEEEEEQPSWGTFASLFRANASILFFLIAHIDLWVVISGLLFSDVIREDIINQHYEEWTECAFRNYQNAQPLAWMDTCGSVPTDFIKFRALLTVYIFAALYGALVCLMHFSSLVISISRSSLWAHLYKAIVILFRASTAFLYDCIMMENRAAVLPSDFPASGPQQQLQGGGRAGGKQKNAGSSGRHLFASSRAFN
jgi:hypothetical protein